MQGGMILFVTALVLGLAAFPARGSQAGMPAPHTGGVAATPDEMEAARQWLDVKFGGVERPAPPLPGIEVLANHNAVRKNGRDGRGLRIGSADVERGLFCHAPSRLMVRLAAPGRLFTAYIGVDNNEQTSGGRGSVIFSVTAGGTEQFRSEVLHGGDEGVPVRIELNGAREFVLEVSDAGDGISCDQADWADAKIEMENDQWVWLSDLPMGQSPLLLEPGTLPFSFVYGGRASSELLKAWKCERASRTLDDLRTERTLEWSDPDSGLQVRAVALEYHDFPTLEWTLYFKNAGGADTAIIENIQALDIGLERGDLNEFVLHHFTGSPANGSDFGPQESRLEPNSVKRIGAAGGRPTNSDMSYFNVESTCRDGLIIAVGWPGQWAADFARDGAKGLRIRAGQELTHFKLLPGEEVRTPLIALQFWNGAWGRAQNLWRRWMMAHNVPKPGGLLPPPQLLASSSRAYEEMIGANEQNQIMFIDRYLEEGLKLDYWWMDAGWYIQKTGWPQVGTWEVDPARFPKGFRPISEHAHANGIKILVWFEPERVAPETWLADNHPEWILGGAKGGLLDLGNDDARKWLTDHVDRLLTEQGIDLYRQDFNMDPLALWRAHDAEDRQGITEIKHVTGLLEYWDELRRRHPDMLIDTCASGGRRIDLETLRRAAPLWRSDYAYEPVGHQGMTYGLSFWVPFHGTGTVGCVNAPYYGGGKTPVEPYAFWSNAAPSLVCGFDLRVRDIDYRAVRALVDQWRKIGPCYYGDFYPLTKYSLEKDAWIGWQFDLPEQGSGVVQVFRRAESVYVGAALPLEALDPQAAYTVQDVKGGEPKTFSGADLMKTGLPVTINDKPGALVATYTKVKR